MMFEKKSQPTKSPICLQFCYSPPHFPLSTSLNTPPPPPNGYQNYICCASLPEFSPFPHQQFVHSPVSPHFPQILLPPARHPEERPTVSQSVNQLGKQIIRHSVG